MFETNGSISKKIKSHFKIRKINLVTFHLDT